MRRLVFAVLAAALAAADAPDANKKDLEKMQGDWAAVSAVRDGMALPDDDAQSLFRTVKGDSFSVSRFDRVVGQGTFTIDATKTPKTLDARPANAPAKAPPTLAIYEFDGERLKVCVAPPGQPRPADFACKAGSGHSLTVWEREKKK